MALRYLILALLLAGCVAEERVPDWFSASTVGRIIATEDSHSYDKQSSMTVPAGNIYLEVPTNETIHTWIYTIKAQGGETIRTKSSQELLEGQCVILWHPPRGGVKTGSSYNYVRGVVKVYDHCL